MNIKQAKKLITLKNEPMLVFFDEIQSLKNKLDGIQGVLKSIDIKEVKTYDLELEKLVSGLQSLKDSLDSKDMVVNIPLDSLSNLKEDFSEASEIISLNGLTPVQLTYQTILRVNSIRATQVGTNLMSVGQIDVRTVTGGNIVRVISAGYTRGRGLTYTVPLGKTLYLTSISVFSGYTTAGKVVRWTGRAKVDDTAPSTKIDFFQPFFEAITQDNNFHADFDMPVSIPATADLKVSALSNGAGSFCSCVLRGWLEI